MGEIIYGFHKDTAAEFVQSDLAGVKTYTAKAGAGLLHYLRICNTTGVKIYAFVFDNTSATGTLLMPPIPIAPNDYAEIQTFALPFTTGCTVSSSSTQKAYTAGGNNDIQVHALTR